MHQHSINIMVTEIILVNDSLMRTNLTSTTHQRGSNTKKVHINPIPISLKFDMT